MEIANTVDLAVPSTHHEALGKRKERLGRRIGRYLLRTLMALVIIAVVAQLSFTFSGSNKWESLGERDGIQLYELKSPGKNIKQYKAVWKVRSTMSRFVAFAKTEDSDMTIGYYDMRDLEAPSEQVVFSTWKQKFPKPFQPRQFVVKNEFIQDPATKVLVYNVMAATEKLPADDCCVRVPTMNNSWTLKPLGNGEIQVEWISDLDMGGFLPYFTLNAFQPGGMRYFARNLQRFLEQEKYDNVKFAWIQEP